MAKRLTDTEKWNDPWYRKLPVAYKNFWDYLCARCDNAGVWKVDMEMTQFQVDKTIEQAEALALFGNRIAVLSPDYWHILGFVPFQFGELSAESKPHKAVLALIQKHQIKGYPKGIHTLKDKDKDKSSVTKESVVSSNTFGTEANFNALWDLYPKKDGRKDALRHFQASVKTEVDLKNIQAALQKYLNYTQGKSEQYIKNGSTWFNNWTDWVNYEVKTGNVPSWM